MIWQNGRLLPITFGFTGRSKIDTAFAQANLVPNIVMSALDADGD